MIDGHMRNGCHIGSAVGFPTFLSASLWVAVAHGQDDAAALVHDFQHDPVEEWLASFLGIALVIGAAILLYSMVRHRGKLTGRSAWALLVAGVGVVPLLSVSFGNLLVFEKAEKVEFCASCHLTMQVYVDDMINPESESLAAVHYKNRYIPSNQCYDCHTSYGMFGTVEAKMDGIIDTYKYYTETYSLPIEMRHPYPNGDCLKCHAESVKWGEQEMHVESKEALFADEMSCMECHDPMGHPAHALPEPIGAGATE